MEEYLTIEDLTKILKISTKKAYQLAAQKSFPKVKIGRNIRIPKTQFEEYMKHNLYKKIL